MENCTEDDDMRNSIALFQLIVYIPVLSLGIPPNMIAFRLFCCKLKRWTETRMYVISLIVADSCMLFALPFLMYACTYDHSRDVLCQFTETMYFINMSVSTYIITFISTDRYIAIKHPLKARAFGSPSKAALLCGLLWVSGIIGATAQIRQSQSTLCFQKDTTVPAALSLLSMFFIFILPLATLTFCSTEAIRSLKRCLNTNSPEEKPIQKAVHILYANLIVFLVCFLPVFFGLLARFVTDSIGATCFMLHVMKNISPMTRCVATSNCCLDSVCHYFVTKEFHEALLPSKTSSEKTDQLHPLQTHTC
ncbi:G-protein coupled receptor 35-like [Pezoporus flaviventris]|uniref:G-protein coupled receptor 35-like n=1 Tax=Pezoporus flaviventris TaxID=889875 RepID=UPI002AB26311|nr:G-protein coupled receptor 35-like [Pezoporus flaviventris]